MKSFINVALKVTSFILVLCLFSDAVACRRTHQNEPTTQKLIFISDKNVKRVDFIYIFGMIISYIQYIILYTIHFYSYLLI